MGGAFVLFVEDNPGLLEAGKVYLEQEGDLIVDAASSAPAALGLLAKKQYDAIVSDYQMPEMNGIEFLKKVRMSDGSIPFIIFTGRGREEVALEAMNNGANFYLQKGGNPKTLYKELAHIIRQVVLMRRTQLTLAEREERYRDLQNANDLIQSIAPDGHFLFVNEKWLDVLGYQESDLPSLTIFDIIHAESLEHCRDLFRRVISGENVGIIDAVFRTRDGERVFVEGIANCRIVDGTPQYTRGIFKDVTERRRAENKFRESEKRFATVFRNSPVALTIVSASDGTFVDVNDTFTQNTGYSRDEMIGKTADELGLFANNREHKKMLASLRDQRSIHGMEISFRVKNGEFRKCLFSSRYVRMGSKPHILSTIEDITERKAAEEALKEREEKFRTIFEHSPYPIAINTIPDGKFIAVNAAFEKSSGYRESEVLDKSPVELKMLSFTDFGRLASRLLISGRLKSIPMTLTGKDGRRVSVMFSTIPVTINHRSAIMTVTVETTKLRQAERELIRINEELQSSEEKFRTIFETSSLGMFLARPDLQFLIVNPALVSMFGYTEKEFPQRSFRDISHPEDHMPDIEGIKALDAGTVPVYSAEKRYIRKDGSSLWGSLKVTAIRNHDDMVRLYFGQIEDITRRKEAQDALKESEERYRSFIEKFKGIAYLSRPNWIPVFIHGAVEEITGYSPDDFKTGQLRWDHLVHPEDLAAMQKRTEKDLLQVPGYVIQKEYRIIRKDGEVRWVSDFIQNLVNEKGEFLLSGILMDITERKRMEETIRENEARYRALLEGSPDVTFIIDKDDRIAFVNSSAANLLGLPPGEIIGRARGSLFPPDIAEAQKSAVEQVFLTGEQFRNTGMLQKDDTLRWFDHYLVPLRDESGEVMQVLGISRDITEQKRVEDELRHTNKKFNLLSRITRHDITNQLQIMDGFAGLLGEKISDPSGQEYLSGLMKASGRIAAMIRIAREYEMIGIYAPAWHNLRDLVDAAESNSLAGHVSIINNVPPDIEVFADPLVSKVLYNLIDNAVRHGGEITTIRFSWESGGKDGILVCEDDGGGIAADDKERIFEAGFGAHTGFGLAISREILGITGITLQETGTPGSGARFEITVPEGHQRTTPR